MRGGRTEPRMVSRTTYNAHAAARHQISSYANFIAAQQALTGVPPPQNNPSAEVSSSGSNYRQRSPSPSLNDSHKRLRRPQVSDVVDSDNSEDGEEMEEGVVIKHEDVDVGFQIPLFGSDRGAESPRNDDEHVCRTNTFITLIL
ncbi:hypothetical protein BYT27DRAFT_7192988 [Phlegmacium glaucopus]|nr:hypothetical protein BYT27DRAFT_7192988 [Phlegmacium glaucopus]